MNQLEKEKLKRHKRAIKKGLGGVFDEMERREVGQVKRDAKEAATVEEQRKEDAKNYNSQEWLENRTPEADRALLEAMQAGKVGACELFYKLMERLKEKQETLIKYELTAEDKEWIASRVAEIQRDFSGGTGGKDLLPTEPPLLSE